jgi:hypothetical protein
MGVGEILDAGIKVYLRKARTLMGLAATVVIPVQVLSGVVLLSIVNDSNQVPNTFSAFTSSSSTAAADSAARLGATLVLTIVGVIQSAVTTAACVKAVSDLYLGQPTGFGASLRFAARRLAGYLGMEVLRGLGLVLAFLCLIAPGVWLYAAWAVAAPALLIERLGPARALGRSRRLVKGRWRGTAGVVLVASIMVALVSGAFQGLLIGVTFLPGQPPVLIAVFVVSVASAISAIIVTPFSACVTTILYYDLRVRKEGYDMQLLADQLGLPPASLDGAPPPWSSPAGRVPGFGPESVGQPGGPPFWPPPPGWRPDSQ